MNAEPLAVWFLPCFSLCHTVHVCLCSGTSWSSFMFSEGELGDSPRQGCSTAVQLHMNPLQHDYTVLSCCFFFKVWYISAKPEANYISRVCGCTSVKSGNKRFIIHEETAHFHTPVVCVRSVEKISRCF